MSVEDPDKIKARIWNLDTIEIRKILRWLNNNIRRTADATVLASAKHEWCHQKILANYLVDDVEKALIWLDAQEPHENPEKSYQREEFQPHGEPLPPTPPKTPSTDPIAQALLAPVMAAVETRFAQFAQTIGRVRTDAEKALETRVRDVILEFGKGIEKRVVAVEDALMASQATSLTILFPDADKKELGTVHRDQALLIKYLAAGCHVFLTGPAGSGKSTAGEKAAEALDLKFSSVSCCSQDTATKFVGYMDATGNYHSTEFREAYSKGGLFLIDEMDAGNPNVLAVLNSALSNSQCAFPDGMVKRHEKFRCMASGNTWGTGKTIQYVGRNAIDAATLNRFIVMHWDYDEALETAIAGLPAWSRYVQQARAEIKRRGINFLITPRASIHGAMALKAGIPIAKVIEAVLFPNLDPDIKKQMPPAPNIAEIK